MPSGQDFTYKSCGINKEGNHYCNRDYGPGAYNQNSYHYSNLNGSYYYSNPNGSTYYNNGKGYSIYTPPGNSGFSSGPGYSSGSTQK